jgi:signal transduction histidine kinase
VLVSVEDNGPGIDPDVASTLFTAGASTKGDGHGGLGLAIAQKFANQMGGQIRYHSQPGKTVFTLELPT